MRYTLRGERYGLTFPTCGSSQGLHYPQIKQFLSYCGGLPAPECSDNPLGYKFSWSSRGVLLALLNSASYISGGKQLDITGSQLMGTAKPYFISPAYAFVAYPNRNSIPFGEWYGIPEAETVVRGTLRYQGFPEFIKALVDLGWLDATAKEWLTSDLTWAEVTQKAIGASSTSETCVERPPLRLSQTQRFLATLSHASRRWQGSPMNSKPAESFRDSDGSGFSLPRKCSRGLGTFSIPCVLGWRD